MGYRDEMFVFVTVGATLTLIMAGVFLEGLVFPPPYKKVGGRGFDMPRSLFSNGNKRNDKKE